MLVRFRLFLLITVFLCGTCFAQAEPTSVETVEYTDSEAKKSVSPEEIQESTLRLLDSLLVDMSPESLLSLYNTIQEPNAHDNLGMNEEEAKVLKEHLPILILKRHVLRISHALSSYLDELSMIIKNRSIKLSKSQQKNILSAVEQLRSSNKSHRRLFSSFKASDIVQTYVLNECMVQFLITSFREQFHKERTFAVKGNKRAPLLTPVEEVVNESKEQFASFNDLFKELGVTPFQKMMHNIGKFNSDHNVLGKIEIAGLTTLALGLLRYFTKDARGDVVEADHTWAPERFGIRNALNFVDNRLIGLQPRMGQVMDGQGRWEAIQPGTGTGIFGSIHRRSAAFLTFVTFATLFKSRIVDAFADNFNSWRGFYNNPSSFLRLGELFKSEKTSLDAVEEIFLTRIIEISQPRITFDDVVGLEEQKRELKGIINYLVNPAAYDRKGTSVEKGYIFYGPTRTGKTYLAEALAGEILYKHNQALSFLKINSAELKVWGVKKALEVIKRHAPCIVFIDEIDLLNLQRGGSTTLLEEFLTSLRSYEHERVIWLGATNRVDHMDNSLLQPGRFGKIIPFENPSYAERRSFFERQLDQRGISAHDIDFDLLARETEGCSFGKLSSIVNDALSNSTQEREKFSQKHFNNSINSFKYKIVQSPLNLPDEEQTLLAVHLAGHTLAYNLLATGKETSKVTMLPIQKDIKERQVWMDESAIGRKITSYGDIFLLNKKNSSGFDTVEQKMNQVKALLAGHVAEKVILGSSGYDYHNDDTEKAYKIVESIVCKGVKKERLSKKAWDAKCEEVLELLDNCEQEVTELLEQNKASLETLYHSLLRKETISASEIDFLLNGNRLEEEAATT